MLADGEGEFISGFAEPFAIQALCAFVGWPATDWRLVANGIRASQGAAFTKDAAAGAAAAHAFAAYVKGVVAHRRSAHVRRQEDLTTSLLHAEIADVPLSDDDIVSVLRNVTAGHGTTAAAVGIACLYLAEHLTLQAQLRADRSLVSAAIGEILRIDDPMPTSRSIVYRGTIPSRSRGMAWTTFPQIALWFARRWHVTSGRTGHVYSATADPEAVLVMIDGLSEGGRLEGEVVVDPAMIGRIRRSVV